MRLEFLAERWKTLFYLICVRNYAETLTTLPTDLQILSHWATGVPIVIHSVAKTAFTSGPLDTALRLGGKWWSSKDVTLLWVRRRGPRSAPVSCANYLSLCSPPHLSFFFADTRMALSLLRSIFTLNSRTEHEVPARRYFRTLLFGSCWDYTSTKIWKKWKSYVYTF